MKLFSQLIAANTFGSMEINPLIRGHCTALELYIENVFILHVCIASCAENAFYNKELLEKTAHLIIAFWRTICYEIEIEEFPPMS